MSGPRLLDARGRAKAYRPLPADARKVALAAYLEAYGRGAFWEAHELLEPAWMGADAPLERELHSGLIKLAAAFVHEGRANPAGVAKNLRGARERLAGVVAGRGPDAGLDLAALLHVIDDRLVALDDGAVRVTAIPIRELSR